MRLIEMNLASGVVDGLSLRFVMLLLPPVAWLGVMTNLISVNLLMSSAHVYRVNQLRDQCCLFVHINGFRHFQFSIYVQFSVFYIRITIQTGTNVCTVIVMMISEVESIMMHQCRMHIVMLNDPNTELGTVIFCCFTIQL